MFLTANTALKVKVLGLAIAAGVASSSTIAQDIKTLHTMSAKEASAHLSDREIIVKFNDQTVLQGLYTNPAFERTKQRNPAAVQTQYASLAPLKHETTHALNVLSNIEYDTGIKLKAVHTLKNYGLFKISASDLNNEDLAELLVAHSAIAEVSVNERVKLYQSQDPFEGFRIKPQTVNPSVTSDPYYQNQTLHYRQSRSFNGAASVERARRLLDEHIADSTDKVNIVILDSGKTPHEDISWTDGYDFANDEEGGWDKQPVTDQDGNQTYHVTGHGLAVAGVIAPTSDNGVGVRGILPHNNVNLIPATAVNDYFGSTFDIYRAVIWSVGRNDLLDDPSIPEVPFKADIINMSIGGFAQCANWQYSSFLQDAVDTAVDEGAVVVAAAGNEAYVANYNSPASCNNTITVGALDAYGEPTDFTNYGEGIDVMALGQTVYSPIIDNSEWKEEDHSSYGGVNGTSFSSPVVAGLVGMIKLVKPDLSPLEIEQVIERTATPLTKTRTGFTHACASIGCGYGAVNFERAMQYLIDPLSVDLRPATHYFDATVTQASIDDRAYYEAWMGMDVCDAFVIPTLVNGVDSFEYEVFGSSAEAFDEGEATLIETRTGSDILVDKSAHDHYFVRASNNSSSRVHAVEFVDKSKPVYCE